MELEVQALSNKMACSWNVRPFGSQLGRLALSLRGQNSRIKLPIRSTAKSKTPF